MVSTKETGHNTNLSNFDILIAVIAAYGATYNPSKAGIKLDALKAIDASAKAAHNAVNAALPAYSNAIAARRASFEPLSRLATRILNAIKATDTTTQVDETVNHLIRKIQGKRATPKKTVAEKEELAATGVVVKESSSSQMGFDNRIDSLDKLIKLLSSIALYAPNEADIKVAALTALYNDLKAKNTAVITSQATLLTARMMRNDILYKENVGLVDLAFDVKTYVKSIYGATSPQYKQVAKLRFKSMYK